MPVDHLHADDLALPTPALEVPVVTFTREGIRELLEELAAMTPAERAARDGRVVVALRAAAAIINGGRPADREVKRAFADAHGVEAASREFNVKPQTVKSWRQPSKSRTK